MTFSVWRTIRFLGLAGFVALGTAFTDRPAGADGSDAQTIFRSGVDDPLKADAGLRDQPDFESKMYLVLLLAMQSEHFPDATDRIKAIIDELAEIVRTRGKGQRFFNFYKKTMTEPPTNDGSLANVVYWIRYLSVASDGRMGDLMEPIRIPCEFYIRHKELRYVSSPALGSSMDNYFPNVDCLDFIEKVPGSLLTYRNFIWRFAGDYQKFGTIQVAQFRRDQMARRELLIFPKHSLPSGTPRKNDCDLPLSKWAYLSLWNWENFQRSKVLAEIAQNDMTKYYVEQFGLDTDVARFNARRVFASQGFEGYWSNVACPTDSLRHAILSGVPTETIARGLEDGTYDIDEWKYPSEREGTLLHPYPIYSRNGGPKAWKVGMPVQKPLHYEYGLGYAGRPVDLAQIAVLRADVLGLLIRKGVELEKTHYLGKTPLMTASQYDQLDSVRLLVEAGVDVDAKTDGWPSTFGQRTALMYAAANASLPLIEALIDAGADPSAVDDQDNMAIDYLDGLMPPPDDDDYPSPHRVGIPPNPKLSEAEFEEARLLLTPLARR